MSWYWNEIGDKDSARHAVATAVWVSYLIALLDGVMAILSLIYHKPVNGMNGWGLLDAGVFIVVGWRIGSLSRAGAIVGLFFYLVEVLISTGTRGLTVGGLGPDIVAIVFLVAYVNALR